jgi:hypothetical protein
VSRLSPLSEAANQVVNHRFGLSSDHHVHPVFDEVLREQAGVHSPGDDSHRWVFVPQLPNLLPGNRVIWCDDRKPNDIRLKLLNTV